MLLWRRKNETKTMILPPTLTLYSASTRHKSTGTFSKKKGVPLIFHMPLLCPLYLFWEQSISSPVQSYFLRNLAKDEPTGLNWFLLSQTFNLKRKLLLRFSCWLYLIYLFTSIWQWLPNWSTHEGSYVCEGVISKIQYDKLTNKTISLSKP